MSSAIGVWIALAAASAFLPPVDAVRHTVRKTQQETSRRIALLGNHSEEIVVQENCATKLVQDGALCGFNLIENIISDGAKCGWSTCHRNFFGRRQAFPCPKRCPSNTRKPKECRVKTSCRYRLRIWLTGELDLGAYDNITLDAKYVRHQLLDGANEVKLFFAADDGQAVSGILNSVVDDVVKTASSRLGGIKQELMNEIVERSGGVAAQSKESFSALGDVDGETAMKKSLRQVFPLADINVANESQHATLLEKLEEQFGKTFGRPSAQLQLTGRSRSSVRSADSWLWDSEDDNADDGDDAKDDTLGGWMSDWLHGGPAVDRPESASSVNTTGRNITESKEDKDATGSWFDNLIDHIGDIGDHIHNFTTEPEDDEDFVCKSIIAEAERRNSAERQNHTCKCPKGTVVDGEAPSCQELKGQRYFPDTLEAEASCRCEKEIQTRCCCMDENHDQCGILSENELKTNFLGHKVCPSHFGLHHYAHYHNSTPAACDDPDQNVTVADILQLPTNVTARIGLPDFWKVFTNELCETANGTTWLGVTPQARCRGKILATSKIISTALTWNSYKIPLPAEYGGEELDMKLKFHNNDLQVTLKPLPWDAVEKMLQDFAASFKMGGDKPVKVLNAHVSLRPEGKQIVLDDSSFIDVEGAVPVGNR